jgi:23S rRNA U2552 (ribose-2'-O)-methylase RlmE/FtsJ
MKLDFATSNLSKIATKFRTSGAISQPRRKAGSSLNELGVTTVKVVKCATQDDYLNRLHYAFENTTDEKLKKFIYHEIRKIHVQRGTW